MVKHDLPFGRYVLLVPKNFFALEVPVICFCENVFCHLPRDYSEADYQVVPWILLPALFEDGHDIYCFPDIKDSPRECVLSRIVRKTPAVALASSKHLWMCSI